MCPGVGGEAGRVDLDRVVVRYGRQAVLHEVSLHVEAGEFVSLLGPSGCGKTTTLRTMAGLARVSEGTVRIDGRLANDLPAHRRGIGMVFQDLALFPHMSVYRNVEFGLGLRGVRGAEARERIGAMVEMLQLRGLEGRLPAQLSGGQQQRVALARSLVVRPSVLLLDEPFASLDRRLREELRREVRGLQRRLGITAVFVTHDQEEALTMSDRVVVLNHGRIEQAGTPSEVYETPASRFVMSFVGFANFLGVTDVERGGGVPGCRLAGERISVAGRVLPQEEPRSPELALRPEQLRVGEGPAAAGSANRVRGIVADVTYEGAQLTYEVALGDGQRVLVREPNRRGTARAGYALGDEVAVSWDREEGVLFE